MYMYLNVFDTCIHIHIYIYIRVFIANVFVCVCVFEIGRTRDIHRIIHSYSI